MGFRSVQFSLDLLLEGCLAIGLPFELAGRDPAGCDGNADLELADREKGNIARNPAQTYALQN